MATHMQHRPPWHAGRTVATFSRGIAFARHMKALLGADEIRLRPSDWEAPAVDYVVGWGKKDNTWSARRYAERHQLPYVHLEDGFVRSVGLGVQGSPAYALVLDEQGIYYDATRESRLERMLNGLAPESVELDDPTLVARANACMALLVTHQISKYNHTPVAAPDLPERAGRKRVLIVDQTAGDMSIRLGRVPEQAFASMLQAAREEHPEAQLLIKAHPDVLAGKKGSAMRAQARRNGALVLSSAMNPLSLLQQVDHVYVATSQLGFEALLCGKPVTCFGTPFYAGWGLTDDRVPCERRTAQRSLAQVFAAAYILYSRYVNPLTGAAGELEDVIEHMARQRAMFAENQGAHHCLGFSGWKRSFMRAYLRSPGHPTTFARGKLFGPSRKSPANAKTAIWGSGTAQHPATEAAQPVTRIEDGFLRSPGLGSDITVPASLVVDRRGIYYDPTTPSDLEHLLAHSDFSADELRRAQELRKSILEARVSKYNLGENRTIGSAARRGQKVILIPGQVETDASIRLGCVDIRKNLDLVAAVRAARPHDYLVYKPHPDVLSGNRRGRLHADAALAHCDEIVTDVHIHHCLSSADEVHTMTSLVGFEGLLREKPVFTYGQPFYAGWGLTTDRHPLSRRQRRLCLDELVAGALLRYPRYVHPETLEFITPEAVVQYLKTAGTGRSSLTKPMLVRQLERLGRVVVGVASVR